MKTRKIFTRRCAQFLLTAALGICCSCNSSDARVLAKDKEAMTIKDWKKIALGRSEIIVPAEAQVVMKGEVNEVQLTTKPMPAGKTLDQLWKERISELAAGKGWQYGQTSVRKTYTGTHQAYYQIGKDPELLVNLERWVQIGDTLVEGVTIFNPRYLTAVEGNMDSVFAHANIGGTPGPGTFVVDNLIVSLPMNGGESVDADIKFDVPATAPATSSRVSVTVSQEALKTPGNVTVLSRIAEAKHAQEGLAISVLRSGRKTYGGLPGEESILAFRLDNTARGGLRAEFESGGIADHEKAPQTDIMFVAESTQRPDNAALTACWDHLVSSISFR